MDYMKKTFLKSLGTLIEEYSSLIGVEVMALEAKSSVESQIEGDAKDDSPDSKRKVKLDTLDSLNKTTVSVTIYSFCSSIYHERFSPFFSR